jgi:hypothetical protein
MGVRVVFKDGLAHLRGFGMLLSFDGSRVRQLMLREIQIENVISTKRTYPILLVQWNMHHDTYVVGYRRNIHKVLIQSPVEVVWLLVAEEL